MSSGLSGSSSIVCAAALSVLTLYRNEPFEVMSKVGGYNTRLFVTMNVSYMKVIFAVTVVFFEKKLYSSFSDIFSLGGLGRFVCQN